MWMEVIFCLFGTAVLVLVLFILNVDSVEGDDVSKSRWSRLQKLWDEGTFKNKPLKVSKDVIYAMMQRGIYSLNSDIKTDDDGGEVRVWAREMLERSFFKLEQSQPNILLLKKMANDFIEKVEKSVEVYEDNLCKLNNDLGLIIEAHQLIKKEIQKQSCKPEQQITVRNNYKQSWIAPVPSIRCPIIADAQAEDDFLTTLDQFEKERGIL